MQHGMHNSIELLEIERNLVDLKLKYHYLIADEQSRHARPHRIARLMMALKSPWSPRIAMTHEPSV